MTNLDIARQRLSHQLIAGGRFEKPGEVVQWLGAVQAQDYAAAKWAVGLRLQEVTDSDIERACENGELLRTHVMRPTWHFVSPADIRWMLALTAPRVNAANAHWYRRSELDDDLFLRSNAVLTKALQGGKQLTRAELASALKQAGIAAGDLPRLSYIMMRAELDGVVCSGARRGKQFTYALLEERAPQVQALDRDEALATFARRYFSSHGPATLQDFVWWSGLTTADARTGLELAASHLLHEVIDGRTYWFSMSAPPAPHAKDLSQAVYLLPNFDEYTVGYTDRSAVFDESHRDKLDSRYSILSQTILLAGEVVGTWKRTMKKEAVMITPKLFMPPNQAETRAVVEAANRYGAFLEKTVDVSFLVE